MKELIKAFKAAGYQLFMVGGSVRDEVLGREPNDIDFATDATPEQMIDLGVEHWTTENGLKHGTVVFREGGVDYEVTTYREDVACDGRHAEVKFAKTLPDDLSRRDFTMNALAKDAYTGEITDPHGGMDDINNKIIRFVGKAEDRITEDYLRLFRAYRFLSKLGKGWKFKGVLHNRVTGVRVDEMFEKVSKERMRDELLKMFAGNPCFALYHMPEEFRARLFPMMPKGYHGHYHAEDVEVHSMVALATACRISKDPLFRLTAYLHDWGKNEYVVDDEGFTSFPSHDMVGADTIQNWMKEMCFSNEQIRYVTTLVEHHMFYYPEDEKGHRKYTARLVRKVGPKLLEDLIKLRFCDNKANLANTTRWVDWRDHPVLNMYDVLLKEEAAFKVTDLKIDGHDCIRAGLKGKAIGVALELLFREVEDEKLNNDRKALLAALEELK